MDDDGAVVEAGPAADRGAHDDDRAQLGGGPGQVDDRLVDGEVHDDLRVWYARTHLEAVRTAIAEGIPVDGFFQWSYADNIEWVLGRDARYGVVYIDYDDDFRRIPKDSYRWFQQLLGAS